MDDERHPCAESGCDNAVLYDDEPYCFKHSPDSGSNVVGYSYKAEKAAKNAASSATTAQEDCSNKPKCHQCGGSGCWACYW